jgi:hypothetical protein
LKWRCRLEWLQLRAQHARHREEKKKTNATLNLH